MENNNSQMGFTPYEQVKIGHMQSKRASGTAIAGLVVGVGAPQPCGCPGGCNCGR